MRFFRNLDFNDGMDQYRLSPEEIVKEIARKKGDVVYTMQLDQPLNNADILIFDDARKNFIEQGYKNPILLIHLQSQSVTDISLTNRFKQIQVHFQEGLLNPDTTIISIWPSFRLGAGPTEALWQVSSRSNCGVTHFIMGQDPAGVKHPENKRIDCYSPDHGFDLADIVTSISNVQIIPQRKAALNVRANKIEFVEGDDTYDYYDHLRMKKMWREGKEMPEAFMHKRAWEAHCQAYIKK